MYIHDRVITTPQIEGDGILIRGSDGNSDVIHTLVDFSGLPTKAPALDEAASFVDYPVVYVERCRFVGAGKLCLCGSGDNVPQGGYVQFHECIFENFGRRGPEVQDGIIVELSNCLIRNWGIPDRMDTRNFAAWAHDGGEIIAQDCVFWQDTIWHGVQHFVKDIANWIGYSWKRKSWNILEYLTMGTLRALTKSQNGEILAKRCYKNKLSLWIQGHEGPYMSKKDALALIEYLEKVCPTVATHDTQRIRT